MSRRLWALLAAGAVVRLVIARATNGVPFDQGSFAIVDAALRDHGFSMYAHIESARWPYPPGYFPWVLTASELTGPLGLAFQTSIRLLPIAADLVLAWLVQDLLRVRGASERTRLTAAGLVALGPIFIGVSAHNAQLDPVAILPAVAALWVWISGGPRRALYAGMLIGAGAAMKTVPGLMVLALLPSARDRREALTLLAGAVVLPALVFAPFVLATPSEALRVFSYHGVPGFGGISLLAQPSVATNALAGTPVVPSDLLLFLRDHGHQLFLAPALLGLAALFWRRRPEPLTAAVLLWLTVWVFGGNFFLQYLVWGLPFLLAAGHLRAAAAIQLGLLVPLLLTYTAPVPETWAVLGYTVPMIAAWAVALAALGLRTR